MKKRIFTTAITILVVLVFAGPIVAGDPLAQEIKGSSDGTNDTGGDSLRGLLQTLGALAVVIALIFCVRLAVRRFSPSASPAAGSKLIEVLARKSLTPKHQVFLLKAGGKEILVAASPSGMNVLSQVTPKDETDQQGGEDEQK